MALVVVVELADAARFNVALDVADVAAAGDRLFGVVLRLDGRLLLWRNAPVNDCGAASSAE